MVDYEAGDTVVCLEAQCNHVTTGALYCCSGFYEFMLLNAPLCPVCGEDASVVTFLNGKGAHPFCTAHFKKYVPPTEEIKEVSSYDIRVPEYEDA